MTPLHRSVPLVVLLALASSRASADVVTAMGRKIGELAAARLLRPNK